ncbi:MAG: PAS domain-containing protein [Planctomycetaceae bacterium]
MQTGEVLASEDERLVWPDGGVSWMSSIKVPLKNAAGEIVGTLGISRDITENHEIREQQQQEPRPAADPR